MMVMANASESAVFQWEAAEGARTEPRIVLQMVPAENAKLKPTVFLPSLLLRE